MSKNLILVYPGKISPNSYGDISLALLYLAGSAHSSGVCDSITVFDFNVPFGIGKTLDDLINLIKSKEGTTVVGINCVFSGLFPNVREIAKGIKESLPDTKIITGGMHPTLFAKEIIDNCTEFDAVGLGEFDLDFPKLLNFFFGEGSVDDLDGVCLRFNDKTLVKPKISYIHDLDALPHPGYEFFNFQDYATDTSNWWDPDKIKISSVTMPILTSRSCPNKCSFCSMRLVMGNKFRTRSAESVFEEIKYLYDTYGINYFWVEDDNLTLDRKRIVKICKMIIESGIKAYFEPQNGISLKTLDEEVVGLMRRAGFAMVSLAVESGSDYIRNKIMGKRTSREQIVNAFKLCKDAGIETRAFFIVGMPEETEETLRETIDIMQEIDFSRVGIFPAKPLPGTKLFEQCVRDKLLVNEINADTLWSGESDQNLAPARGMKSYINYLLDNAERQFWIKPYNLSMKRLAELDLELRQAADEKTSAWVEHLKNQRRQMV